MNRRVYIFIEKLAAFLSRRQVEYQQAWGVVGQVFTLLTFETFAIVFTDKFGITGYPSLLIYVVAPVLAVLFLLYLGNKMIKTEYVHKYQKYGMDQNKDWVRAMETIERLNKYLDEREHERP